MGLIANPTLFLLIPNYHCHMISQLSHTTTHMASASPSMLLSLTGECTSLIMCQNKLVLAKISLIKYLHAEMEKKSSQSDSFFLLFYCNVFYYISHFLNVGNDFKCFKVIHNP